MKYFVYSLKDQAIESFLIPMFMRSEGEARRGLSDAVNKPDQGSLHDHPEHFSLWLVGLYDDETGIIESRPPEFVCNCVDLVRQVN